MSNQKPSARDSSPAATLLESGRLDSAHVRTIAERLAELHRAGESTGQRAPRESKPAKTPEPAADLARTVRAIEQAFPEATARSELREIEQAQREFLTEHSDRFRARGDHTRTNLGRLLGLSDFEIAESGSVEIGLEAVAALTPLEPALDVANIALDLALGRRGDLAERFLSAYASVSTDFDLYGVVDFYERGLALTRAAEPDCSREEIRDLLLLALSTRRRPLLPPILIVVGGLVASGKSTVARLLADRLGAPRIEGDRVRARLDGYGSALEFTPEFAARGYTELARFAELILDSGRPVVLDGCFPHAEQREQARALARRRGWPFLFVECRIDRETAVARLEARDERAARAGWQEISRRLAHEWEPTEGLLPEEHLVLDTRLPIAECEAILAERIPIWPDGLPG